MRAKIKWQRERWKRTKGISESPLRRPYGKPETAKKGGPQAEDNKLKVRRHVVLVGPRTAEEQLRYDILNYDMEWKDAESNPDTACLQAELIGADSFEMEVME